MRYRTLGRTGLSPSELSLGGAAFGQMYGSLGDSEAEACLRLALDSGVNLIDTSPFYGHTESESALGRLLSDVPRDSYILSTKAGRSTREDFDFRPESIRRSVRDSLRRLGVEHVELLFAHDIEFAEDIGAIFEDTVGELGRLKEQGLTRFVGVSALPLGLLAEAVRRCPIDAVMSYTHYTIQNRRLVSELLPIAQEKGVGLINASPLCMGLLTDAGPPPWHPAPPELVSAVDAARDYCRRHGLDLGFLAMQFALQQEVVASTVTGTGKPSELAENLRAIAEPMPADHLMAVEAILAPVMGVSWPSGHHKAS